MTNRIQQKCRSILSKISAEKIVAASWLLSSECSLSHQPGRVGSHAEGSSMRQTIWQELKPPANTHVNLKGDPAAPDKAPDD